MKKKWLVFLLALATSVTAVTSVTACGGNGKGNSTSVEQPNEEETYSWTVTMPNGVQYQNAVNVPSISVYEECSLQTTLIGATYVSSDSSILNVTNLGIVRALKAGNASITVSAGEDSQTVNFTVNDAGNVPIVALENSNVPKNEDGQHECNLFVGGAINIGAKLKYNGIAYADASFIYETDDAAVATIDKGMVRAVGQGTTTVRAKVTNWRGYASEHLLQTVIVNVIPTLSLSVAEEEIELSTKTITDEITVFDLQPTAIVNEAVDEDATFTYEYDETIVQVSDAGEVTAVGEGETQVKIVYTAAGGYSVEKYVTVKVTLPIVKYNVTFTVDKSGMTLDKSVFVLPEDENYARITDVKTGEIGAFVNGVFTGGNMPTGERNLVVYTNKQGYEITALVVDKIIKSEADLRSLQTTKDIDAYYVLGGNIQLTQTFDGITTGTFKGTFDGNGYTVSGGKITYGLLGKTTLDATVKNLAIIGVGLATLPPANTTCHGGLLAQMMTGVTTVENVYLNMNNPDGWAAAVGVWAYCVKGVFNAKNVVSYVTTDRANMSSFINWTPDSPKLNITNAHCGSAVDMKLIVTGAPASVAATQYKSKAAMLAAYANNAIDVSWASGFQFYTALTDFLSGK